MPWKSLSEPKFVGEAETGKVYEQPIRLTFTDKISKNTKNIGVRRILIKLNKATRNGDREIALLLIYQSKKLMR